MRFYYYNPAIGPKFIRRLFSEMGVTIFRSSRQGVDWLAKGRFALCFFCSTQVERAKQQGLPVDSFGILKEGANLVFGGGTIGLVNRAPHPNAAKLFINWFLSREGQLAAYQAMVKIEDMLANLGESISRKIMFCLSSPRRMSSIWI